MTMIFDDVQSRVIYIYDSGLSYLQTSKELYTHK